MYLYLYIIFRGHCFICPNREYMSLLLVYCPVSICLKVFFRSRTLLIFLSTCSTKRCQPEHLRCALLGLSQLCAQKVPPCRKAGPLRVHLICLPSLSDPSPVLSICLMCENCHLIYWVQLSDCLLCEGNSGARYSNIAQSWSSQLPDINSAVPRFLRLLCV